MTKWGTTHGTIKTSVLTFLGFRNSSGAGRVVCPWHPLRWLPPTSVRFYPHYLCCWAGGVQQRPPAPPRRLLSFVLWGRCPHCPLPVRCPCVARALAGRCRGALPPVEPPGRGARAAARCFSWLVGGGAPAGAACPVTACSGMLLGLPETFLYVPLRLLGGSWRFWSRRGCTSFRTSHCFVLSIGLLFVALPRCPPLLCRSRRTFHFYPGSRVYR